ncbi:MAG: hypothetical protein JWR01_2918 [Subtercola sp.]|nr:hypothetical protein [Subtercola sp.]
MLDDVNQCPPPPGCLVQNPVLYDLDNRPTYLQKISSLSPPPREIILARFNGQGLQELLLA